ncbi:MAG: hypothetical protein M3Z17_08430 [Gemmatimonadota bacterium]|nr:hypothetical protein [Gemmatimonadota bacterium]
MRTAGLTIFAALLTGCASAYSAAHPSPGAASEVQRPLEQLAGQSIVVLPTQYLSFGDSLGWRGAIARRAEYLAGLDDEIGFALGERGLSRKWTFANAISRAARNNSTVIADPHALSAESLRGHIEIEETLVEPLGSQIRSLLALGTGRFVLLPVELRTESANGTGVAVLKLMLIDARLAKVKWIGEVKSERLRQFSPALAASVASRLADLIAP